MITPASGQMLRRPADSASETGRIVLERAEAVSLPGQRSDPHRVALVIEGGGMGGAVSAGMCVLLEAVGLVASFDMIVACSSGSLNGAWTAAGQAAQGATNYEDLATRDFINPWRLAFGRAPINMALLFGQLARDRKPLSPEALARGPAFTCLATSLDTGELVAFGDLVTSPDRLLTAIWASCNLPVLAGAPVEIDGVRYADGGLIESMPFASAFRLGASHVVVLRSRWPEYRKTPYGRLSITLSRRAHPRLGDLVRERPRLYNEDAEHLEQAMAMGRSDLLMVALPDATGAVGQLERDRATIIRGVQAGAAAAAAEFCTGPVELHWQPRVYAVAGRR
jgi:predicted patatin/cPLA2 family phospholipase